MSVAGHPGAHRQTDPGLRVRAADWPDHPRVYGLLQQDPGANLFILSWLEVHGITPHIGASFEVLLAEERDRLVGLCLVLGWRTAMPVCLEPEAAAAFGHALHQRGVSLEHVVGHRQAVGELWEAYRNHRRARLERPQHFYVLQPEDFLPPGEPSAVRPARLLDLDVLVDASAQMYREETLSDPYAEDPEGFRRMHRRRILQDTCFVWRDDLGRALFKADVSCASSYGAQIAGVFTDPERRGLGIARRAMGDICRMLLSRYPLVTLYVNADNLAAIRLYERLGFRPHCPYQTIFVT